MLPMQQFYIMKLHCVKSVRTLSYSGPQFPTYGLNKERYGVYLQMQSECGKMRTRITQNTDTFHAVMMMLTCECNVIVSLLSVSGLFQGTPSSGLFLL